MKRAVKYTVRALLIALAGILLFVSMVFVALQTPFVKRQIASMAEKQLNALMDASLAIGKLEGNLFSHLELLHVSLLVRTDTVAFVERLRLRYDLWALTRGEIVIDELFVERPYVRLVQLPDSTWNVQHLMKPVPQVPDSASAKPFDWAVRLRRFRLDGGAADIAAFDTLVPRRVQDLSFELSAGYATQAQTVNLQRFQVSASTPDWTVRDLRARIEADTAQVRLVGLSLQTMYNALRADGNYFFDGEGPSALRLTTAPVMLHEFAAYLPQGLHWEAKPSILLDLAMEGEALGAKLRVADSLGYAYLELSSRRLIDYFTDSTMAVQPTYDLSLELSHIDLRDWTGNPSLHYVLNGALGLKGQGLDPRSLEATLNGRLDNLMANGISIGRMDAQLGYAAGDANGRIDLQGAFGSMQIDSRVRQVLDHRPFYQLTMGAQHLNLEPLLGQAYTSDLNLTAFVQGSGTDPKTLQARMRLAVGPSRITAFGIDTVHTELDYERQNVAIKSFFIQTLSATLRASGNYHLTGNTDVDLSLAIDNANEIAAFAELDSLNAKLDLRAQLSGRPNDLTAVLAIGIDSAVYKTMRLESLRLDAKATILDSGVRVGGNAVARNYVMDGLTVDSLTLWADTDTKNHHVRLQAANAEVKTRLDVSVNVGETIEAALSGFGVDYKGYAWELGSDTAHVAVNGNGFNVNGFVLKSGVGDTLQTISANGTFSTDGEEDFRVDVINLDLATPMAVFAPDQHLDGLLSVRMNLTGTARNPVLEGVFDIADGAFHDSRLATFNGGFGYANGFATAVLDMVPMGSGSVNLNAKMPADIRIDSAKFDLAGNKHAPVEGTLLIRQIPLSLVNAFFPTDEVGGILQSDIALSGTIGKPDFNGSVGLVDGKLKVDRYGIDYRQMQAGLTFSNNQVAIDTFNIRSRKGNMFAKGDARFASDLYEGKMDAAGLRVWFERFNPVDHKQYNLEVSGRVDLKADADSARFSGDLTIPEALVFVPAILNLMGETMGEEVPLPLLAAQLQKDSLSRDSVVYRLRPDTLARPSEEAAPSLAFLDNLQGKLNLTIPRNTWVKSNDMRFELGGDLQLIKHRDFFELFGTINVLRGQYSLLGKVFVIKNGQIVFEGGEEMDPQLDIEAVYSFRDAERVRRDLLLKLGGSMLSPEISFDYQGEPISEGDALSYILFGTSLEALGASQQESLGAGGVDASDIAKMAAASLVSSQLTKLLGSTMNMDYIEFKSGGSLDNASFVVGKYLTNKLFVSYEQSIGKVEDQDASRYEMRMEYELFRFLFFQLTSSSLSNGFDFIFKFDEKQKKGE